MYSGIYLNFFFESKFYYFWMKKYYYANATTNFYQFNKKKYMENKCLKLDGAKFRKQKKKPLKKMNK